MGSPAQIVRANLDGSQQVTIITGTNVALPSALAVDSTSKSLRYKNAYGKNHARQSQA